MKQLALLAVFALGFAGGAETAVAVTAKAPGSAFLQGEALEFRVNTPAPVQWTLRNWKDEVIRQGESVRQLLLAPLANGYYMLELAGFEGVRSFAVVPDPGKRARNPDQFFAMDSAQSWLARPDGNNARAPGNPYETVSEVARRSGVQMVRERLSWPETETAPGTFDWKQYKTNADLLSERGIDVLGMYHHTPEWMGGGIRRLPPDLLAVYRYAQTVAETFKGRMTAWEFWNEPDHGFSTEAAWDYAACLKAASLGFKAANPEIRVAIGGYAITPLLPYADAVMKSGAKEYFDIFNVHTYRSIGEFPDVLKNVRDHMKRNQIADYPVWVTENGSNMEGSGRIDSFLPGLKAHSPEQEMIVAEYIPKMMITMQSLGVDRDFFFVLPPYSELGGNKDWGLMRRDYTVKPGYAAFATLVDQLGSAKPEGEVKLGDKLKGYLYRKKDGGKVLVYWSCSELDTDRPRPNLSITDLYKQTFALPLKGGVTGVDCFGTPFTAEAAAIPADRYPRFLANADALKADIPFTAPKTVPHPSGESKFDRTVIFRTELSDDFKLFTGKDCADVKRDSARFKLQIWNLSNEAKTGSITVTGGKTAGIPAEVTLPPFGKQELELAFTPTLDKEFKGELRVEGLNATPLVIPLQSVDEMARSGQKLAMEQMLDPANWHKNASGETTFSYNAADRAIEFRTRFAKGADRWAYPEYTLQLPQESLKGALGIGFEVKVSQPVMQMLLMAVRDKAKDLYLKVDPPTETFKECFVAFPPEPDPAKVVKLRLGVNAQTDDITVSVRNIRVFYRR